MPLDAKTRRIVDQLSALVNRAEKTDGLTSEDIAREIRKPGETIANAMVRARAMLREAIASGEWRCVGRRQTVRMDGAPNKAPVYLPSPQQRP